MPIAARLVVEHSRKAQMHDAQSFGYWVRRYRKALEDLTQAQLPERVGCATITIRESKPTSAAPRARSPSCSPTNLGCHPVSRAVFLQAARALPGFAPAGLRVCRHTASSPANCQHTGRAPHELAGPANRADRPRAGSCGNYRSAAPPKRSPGHTDRPWRGRQDPSEPAGSRRASRSLHRRRAFHRPSANSESQSRRRRSPPHSGCASSARSRCWQP